MDTNQNGHPAAPVPRVLLDTLVAMARNSVGSNTWRNFYLVVNGEVKDVTEDGLVSCSFFVSTLLRGLELIRTGHLRVESTVKDMLESGWYEIEEPRVGAVIAYGAQTFQESGRTHPHIGIFITDTDVVTHSDKERSPQIHNWKIRKEDNVERGITGIYWHPRLDAPQLEQQRL